MYDVYLLTKELGERIGNGAKVYFVRKEGEDNVSGVKVIWPNRLEFVYGLSEREVKELSGSLFLEYLVDWFRGEYEFKFTLTV